jgi:penicillin amidase
MGDSVVNFLKTDSGIFADFYLNFDRLLLSKKSKWLNNQTRDDVYRQAAERALAVLPKEWGETRKYKMTNILFGGKLPAFLGFDRGPIVGIGNRATIHQGQIFTSAGRLTTFFPSLRIVADMATDELFTNLIGGPSDRRFSKWYCSDVKNWLSGIYKKLTPSQNQPAIRFD